MTYKMISSKLGRKPGHGGYLANVLKDGHIKLTDFGLSKITKEKSYTFAGNF